LCCYCCYYSCCSRYFVGSGQTGPDRRSGPVPGYLLLLLLLAINI
jgi:hypothetical protein